MEYKKLLENYTPVVKLQGLNTEKDAYFGGTVTLAGGTSRTYTPSGVNDSDEIQTILTTLGVMGGGILEMNPGTYDISGTVSILYDNIKLVGCGDGTKWVLADGVNADVLRVGDGGTTTVENVHISNFQIDGNKTNQTGDTYGVHLFKRHQNVVVDHMYIHDLRGKGIYNDGLSGTRSENIQIIFNRVYDMDTSGDFDCIDNQNTNYLVIMGNDCINPGDDGIDVGASDFVRIIGNTVNGGNTASGIETDVVASMTISGNTITNCGSYALRAQNLAGASITGNTIFDSNAVAVDLVGASYCVVTGNTIRRSSQTTNNTSSSIRLAAGSGNSTFNTISANTIREDGSNKAKYGIEEVDSSQDNNKVYNNTIVGAVTAPFLKSGVSSVFRGNDGQADLFYSQGNVTGATTFSRANGATTAATLTGSITVTLTNGLVTGDRIVLKLVQGGSGSYTATWPSNFKKAGGTLTLSSAVGAVDTITAEWDGTTWNEVSRSLNLS